MASVNQRFRIGRTIYLYLVFAGFGLTMSLGGPSIPDLCERMGITDEEIAIAFSVSSIMWTVGAIVMGPIIDRYSSLCGVFLGTSLTIMAVATFIKPYSPYLWVYVTATAIESLSYAGTDLSSNVMMFSYWGEHSNSPVTGLHASWGLGFAFGPLLIMPFLGPDRDDNDDLTNVTTPYPMTTLLDSTVAPEEESRIEIAYIITGCFTMALAAAAFILYIKGVPETFKLHIRPKQTFRSVFSVKELADGDLKFAVQILVLFALFYFGNGGREGVFNTWLFNYAVSSELEFSKQEAALLDAAAKFSFLGGRVLATLIALKVRIQPMIFTEVYVVFIFTVCLGLLGTREKVYLWVFACLCNAFAAPIWPGGLTWTNRYIVVSGVVFTVMNLGAGVAGFVFNYLSGWLFTNRDANAVMYVLFFCAAIMCVLIVIMQIVASKHGDRFIKIEAVMNGVEKDNAGMELNVDTLNHNQEKENSKFPCDSIEIDSGTSTYL